MKLWQRNGGPAVRLTGPDTVSGRSLQQWAASLIGTMDETSKELRLGPDNFTRTWLVTGYPEGPAYLGRLNRLLRFHTTDPAASRVHVRLTQHLLPSALPDTLRTRWLRNRQEGMATETAERGTPDAATTKALRAYSDIHRAVHFDQDAVLEMWLAVTVTAPDEPTLDRMEHKLLQEARTMSVVLTPLYREQVEGLALSQVLGIRQERLLRAWPGRLTHTLPLSYLYPFLHGSISDGQGCYTGHEIDGLGFAHAGYLDFTRGTGPMAWLIAGMAGEGKSTFIKAMNLGLLLQGFAVFQYDANGEYKAFTDAVGGQHVDMTAASGRYFEPLVIPQAVGDSDYDRGRFARTCQVFHCVIRGLVPELTAQEKDLADKLLMLTWKAAGVDRDNPATWHKSASIHDWYRALCQLATPVAEALRSKLAMYFEGSQVLFRTAETPRWAGVPFVRIAVSDVVSNNAADERIAAVKTLLVTHRVWDAVVANKHLGRQYAMVNIDEGQRVLREPDMATHVYQLATDGRKHNAGLSVAANDINVFFETTGGRGLWENASLRCLFYMADSGLAKAAENAAIPAAVIDQVRTLSGTHEYMLSRNLRRWTRARLELPSEELELYRTRGLRPEEGT